MSIPTGQVCWQGDLNRAVQTAASQRWFLDVVLVFLAEIADGAQDRIRGRLAEAAEGGVLDDGRHLLEELDVALLALALGDVRQDLQHPLGPLAAGGALAAGFILAEVHEEAGHVDGAGVLVHDDQAAGTHDGAQFDHLLVIDGGVEVLHRDACRRRVRRAGRP